ncbi:MAG: dihydroneopterin aldolase [Metallibacterium sp.]
MSDHIYIDALELHCVIGVHAHERLAPRLLLCDVQLACDTRAAAASDRLEHTLDYDAIAQRLRALAASMQPALLETLAERMSDVLQREFGARWLRLRLDKPGVVAGTRGVGIVIERGLRVPG